MDRLGDYRLRKRLAVGGMGEVYLGEKVGPEGFVKPVVLKCVLPQLAKDRAFVQLFLDEARLAALLNHPNIAQIYDFGVTDNVYYMAMEYVPGYTVDDLRRKHTSIDRYMPIEHIACVASQVCQGLHYAHALSDARGVSLGLVHRDVSPHNLIVSVDGGVKIVDFGIAKARAGLTRVQAKGAVGKFGYMAPEQSRGESVDARTDVFSLGVCLWELVTNRRLHDAKIDRPPNYDPRRPVPPVGSFRRDVPRQFERILETALAIDRDDRYASCQEMHLDIERFLAAMTHYAGQAALAGYLKDLVEGKVEQPEQRAHEMVEPVGAKRSSGRQIDASALEGAQRYEEVFGVGAASEQRPSMSPSSVPRAVPASWETKRPQPTPSKTPSAAPPSNPGTPNLYTLKTGLTPQPDTREDKDRDRARAERLKRAEGLAKPSRSRAGLIIAIVVVVAGITAAGVVLYKEQLSAFIASFSAPPPPPPQLSTQYRIVSTPEGASVIIDGKPYEGKTPLVVELSPGLEYRVEVKMPDFATKRATLKATVGEGLRDLTFRLDPAATVEITSEPPGATVEVNGFEIEGVTPVKMSDFPAGQKVTVSVKKNGQPPKMRTVEVAQGKSKKVHFELDQ